MKQIKFVLIKSHDNVIVCIRFAFYFMFVEQMKQLYTRSCRVVVAFFCVCVALLCGAINFQLRETSTRSHFSQLSDGMQHVAIEVPERNIQLTLVFIEMGE